MPLKRSLFGQKDIYDTLDSILENPPHLFLSGPYGFGKTTLAQDFLEAYFSIFGISPSHPEWVYRLSSDSDRGIHKIREEVAEFVRHSSIRKGVLRWIIVDDADTLPFVSQQALRRPMETHAHTTRFLFCSRHMGDLISPLRSRCLHLELETISLGEFVEPFCLKEGLMLSSSLREFLMSVAESPRQLKQYIMCIKALGNRFQEEQFKQLFSGASDERIRKLLVAFFKNNEADIYRYLFDIWNSGISYEDFLTDLFRCSKMMGLLPPRLDQKIHELMIQGWVFYTHGRTHLLDILALFRPPERADEGEERGLPTRAAS